tara:strand:+ start:38 stop:424 length:387 start_codon:yes stop_codon:yes gene_type:complete
MKKVENYGAEIVALKDFSLVKDDYLVSMPKDTTRCVPEGDFLDTLLEKKLVVRVNEAPPPPPEPEPEPEPEVEEEDPLVVALEGLIEEGDPENFKADGHPKAAVVNKLAGRAVTTEERETAWQTALNR